MGGAGRRRGATTTTCPHRNHRQLVHLHRRVVGCWSLWPYSSVALENVDGFIYGFGVHTGKCQPQLGQVVRYHDANLGVGESRGRVEE